MLLIYSEPSLGGTNGKGVKSAWEILASLTPTPPHPTPRTRARNPLRYNIAPSSHRNTILCIYYLYDNCYI